MTRRRTVFDQPYVSPGSDYAKVHRMVDRRGLTACGRRLKVTLWMAGWSQEQGDRMYAERSMHACERCRKAAA